MLVWVGFKGWTCEGGLPILGNRSVLKDLDSVMVEDAKNEFEKLGRPHLPHSHTIMLTISVYSGMKDLMQLA